MLILSWFTALSFEFWYLTAFRAFHDISILKLVVGVEPLNFTSSILSISLENLSFIYGITDFCPLNLNKSYIFHHCLAWKEEPIRKILNFLHLH